MLKRQQRQDAVTIFTLQRIEQYSRSKHLKTEIFCVRVQCLVKKIVTGQKPLDNKPLGLLRNMPLTLTCSD